MPDINTNFKTRKPSRMHTNEVEVFEESDFPAAASGIITLEADTTYRLMAPISTANVFALPAGEDVEMMGHSLGAELIYTGTVTTGFITSSAVDTGTVRFNGLRIELEENDTIVFDLASTTGGTVLLNEMSFIYNGTGQGLGNFDLLVVDLSRIFMFNPELGSTLTNCVGFMMNISAITPTAADLDNGTLFRFVDGGLCKTSLIQTDLNEDDNIFYFDPLMAGPIVLDDVTDISPTKVNLFEAGTSFAISAFADATGGDVTATATGHTYANGDHILITNSVLYHGGYDIFGVSGNDFDFTPDAGWGTDDAQASTLASDGSLTEMDSRVMVVNSPGYKSSQTLCGVWAEGNTVDTAITTQNVYVDLDLDTLAVPTGHIEEFILEDADNGQVVYIGEQPTTICVTAIVSGQMAAGGAINIKFQLLQNGVVLPTPDDVEYITRWITTDPLQTSCEWIVTAIADDNFRVQVANTEGTDDITITQYSFTMA